MANDVTLFKSTAVGTPVESGSSALLDIFKRSGGVRRIKTNAAGTFQRIVGGKQVGKAVRGKFNGIIVSALPQVSRTYYEGAYDKDNTSLPDCWSNLGDKPDPSAPNPQATACISCPQNEKGSGGKDKRACKFQRRVAVMLEGDESGELYQLNIPGTSLFGEGNLNSHPFEPYGKMLAEENWSIDRVVTEIAYDDEAEYLKLLFTPVRPINTDELELVEAAQADPKIDQFTTLTVAQADGVTRKPEKKEEVADEPAEEPTPKTKTSLWGDDGDEEGETTPEPTPRKRKPKPAPEVKAKTIDDKLAAWAAAADAEDGLVD